MASALLSLIADTFEDEPALRANHIPAHWYEWAKATVAIRSDFFEASDDDSLRDDVLQSIQVIEGRRKALEE